ncbi:hypothetical protein EJ02DRAFT_302898, partial [Clathrospora elynae]
LQRIEGQLDGDSKLAREVLSWITFAKRPLTTAEICCALAVEPNDAELDLENIPDIEDLVSVCAGLVVVDPESAIIRLVHYTTQDYFEKISNAWNPSANLHITTTCLTYLSFSAFQDGSCSTDREFKERLQQNKFLDYAAKHWGEHATWVETEVFSQACRMLLQSNLLSCATQVLFITDINYENNSQTYPKLTPLHYTARFGLCGVTKGILPEGDERATNAVNSQDSWRKTPLFYAARHGHVKIAQLLLEKNADVN